ncbi:hypothetical protein F4806DRAFT_466005 [Annulohypoxylon nitens]|nr:hypothetical protein F4806DRAFT_466005 [Annulohypoxylon nitens]
MAPTRPARGAAAKENGTTEAAAATAGDAPVKRGRGRPPKNGIAPQEKKAPSGRPRGRPAGTTGVKKATKPAPPKSTRSGAVGRRGRPRKSDAPAVTTPKKTAATPKSASKTASTGKGRGRPRKSSAPAPQEEEEESEETEEKAEEDEVAAANDDIALDDAAEDDIAADDDVPLPEED